MIMLFYGRGASFPQTLCPLDWLSLWDNTPFAWLPAEQTKVVSMGAPLNKYGFEMSLLFICMKMRSGLSALLSWKSTESSSTSTEHQATPKSSWLAHLEDDNLAYWALEDWGRELSCWGLVSESLLRDLDLANSLGGEREREREREGGELERRGFHAKGILVGEVEEKFVGVFFLRGIFPMKVMRGVPVVEIV